MPLDDELPPSRLPARSEQERIVQHFTDAFGVRVDPEGLDVVQEREHVSFIGARLPKPLEAVLMDRVLQLVPVEMLRGVERIVMLPSRGTARYGGYLNGIIRLAADPAWRRTRDAEFGGNYSLFTTTLLHEVGHAVYRRWLTDEQRALATDLYLNWFIRQQPPGTPQPTAGGGEHFFIALFCSALLGANSPWGTTREAREFLDALGVRLD